MLYHPKRKALNGIAARGAKPAGDGAPRRFSNRSTYFLGVNMNHVERYCLIIESVLAAGTAAIRSEFSYLVPSINDYPFEYYAAENDAFGDFLSFMHTEWYFINRILIDLGWDKYDYKKDSKYYDEDLPF